MDPDATLADIRHTVREYEAGRTDLDFEEFLSLVDSLDQWITKGGFLPASWEKARRAA
jgi:hypothetical protein